MKIKRTEAFATWFDGLRDMQARARIQSRLDRVTDDNFGTWRDLKSGLRELKIDYGPGYRVYYTQRGKVLVVLLAGGDKRTQKADIRTARQLLEGL